MKLRAILKIAIVTLSLSLVAAAATWTAFADGYPEDDDYKDNYNDDFANDYVPPLPPPTPLAPAILFTRRLPTLIAYGRVVLTPEGVEIALEDQGYFHVRRVVYTGGIYTAIARSRRGFDVSLWVDASTGFVITPFYYYPPYYYGPQRAGYVAPATQLAPPARTGRYAPRKPAGPALMPFARVREALERLGYVEIVEAGYEDGIFRVEAGNARGDRVRLVVDAYSGELLYDRVVNASDDPWSEEPYASAIVKKRLLKASYTDIRDIQIEGDVASVLADDSHGNEVRLTVERSTGKVLKTDYIG